MDNSVSKRIYEMLEDSKKISAANPKKAYEISQQAYNLAVDNRLRLEKGYALIAMSFVYRATSELSKWLDCSYNALNIFEDLNDQNGIIKASNLIGIAYFYSSSYEQALKYLLQASDLLENSEDKFMLSCILNNIGEVYRESGRDDKALQYFNRSLDLCRELNLDANTAAILNNVSKIYFERFEYNKALECCMKSYELLFNRMDLIALGEAENLIGEIYNLREDYDKSEKYYFSALKRLEAVENKFYAIDVLINIGKLKLLQNSHEAFIYFDRAIQYAEEMDSRKKLSKIYSFLSEYYEMADDYINALKYFKKYFQTEREIAAEVMGNKLEALQIEMKYLKADKKFEEMRQINQRLETEIVKNHNELENIKKINRGLEKKVLEDELTKVPNRRYLSSKLDEIRESSLESGDNIALFIIDIDNFKKYNDFWGHLKGDKCLVKISHCLRKIQRSRNDVFGRYGGEEFIYYAAGLDYQQALDLGNLLKDEVEKLQIKYILDDNSRNITISIGGAFGKASDFTDMPNMLQIADEELYKAKGEGRNKVRIRKAVQ